MPCEHVCVEDGMLNLCDNPKCALPYMKATFGHAHTNRDHFSTAEFTKEGGAIQNELRCLFGLPHFINHACEVHANVYPAIKYEGFVPKNPIKKGDEITFCYSATCPYPCDMCEKEKKKKKNRRKRKRKGW